METYFLSQANKENNIDIYLFGLEEQEYIKDVEQTNADKQKHVSRFFDKKLSIRRKIIPVFLYK